MSSAGGKSVSTAAVVKFVRDHLKTRPEEGPAIVLAVQAGDFRFKVKEVIDTLPDYKTLARLSEEDKINMMSKWMPMMSAPMWAKVKKAAGEDDRSSVVHRCFYSMVLESEKSELPTRSRSLLEEIFDIKRKLCKQPQLIVLDANFKIDWGNVGVYMLSGKKSVGTVECYTHLEHKPYNLKVVFDFQFN